MIDETEMEEQIALAEQCSEDKEIQEAFKKMFLYEGKGNLRKVYKEKYDVNHPKHQQFNDAVNSFLTSWKNK